MFNFLSRFLAFLITRKPWLLIGLAAVVLATSLFAISREDRFDSDILNLLPSDNRAVQGLKIYNRDFTQSRELAFLIRGKSANEVDAFADFFIQKLREQSWTLRILDGPPIETESGRESFPALCAPLLLNLPTEKFQQVLAKLTPTELRSRLERLAKQVKSGSPRAEFELANDPLGIVTAAMAPLAETISLETDFALVSPSGNARLIPVIVRPELTDAPACAALMDQVHTLIDESRLAYGSTAPEVGVTGRAAYVAEISRSMQRDIQLTSMISLAAISILFWIGYRRIFPLIGTALILSGCAVAALGSGTFFYSSLNIVAIGFCSILFGLGNDYSLLIYEAYRDAWRRTQDRDLATRGALDQVVRGVCFVAITTCIGFLALRFSGSVGFAQLGVLTSLGVAFCAVAMLSLFLLWLRFHQPSESGKSEAIFLSLQSRLTDVTPSTRRMLIAAFVIFTFLAVAPWRSIQFDLSPASLEPKDIPASVTLKQLQTEFPDSFEPVMIVGQGAELAARVDARLRELKNEEKIIGFSGASSLLFHSDRLTQNLKTWQQQAPSEAQLTEVFAQVGLDYAQFPAAAQLINQLQNGTFQTGTESLSETSPWWFLIDRLISIHSNQFIAYVHPLEAGEFDESLLGPISSEVYVTGWSTLLRSLVPWAKQELLVYGGAVAGIILIVLAAIYRDIKLWGLHVLGLIFAYGGLAATLKIFDIQLNLLNVLAFPLILGTGVDYGTHLLLTLRHGKKWKEDLGLVFRPILFGALTTVAGFGALIAASNPALRGLGLICALGVGWTLLSALLFILPGVALLGRRK